MGVILRGAFNNQPIDFTGQQVFHRHGQGFFFANVLRVYRAVAQFRAIELNVPGVVAFQFTGSRHPVCKPNNGPGGFLRGFPRAAVLPNGHQPAHGIGGQRILRIKPAQRGDDDSRATGIGVHAVVIRLRLFPVGAGGADNGLAGDVTEEGFNAGAIIRLKQGKGHRQIRPAKEIKFFALFIQ